MPNSPLVPGWATYLRVSDEDKQSPERSFAMQRQRISDNLLNTSKLPLWREYRDKLTGTTPNRRDYQQLLTDAQRGRFSHLGLYRADRFGRNAAEGLQAATQLIGFGIRIRVAHMPTLQPETPDGFFMFLLQMGMAQHEVDVLRQRTQGGMEAKLRAGGWCWKAPEGYVNKEELVKSGKYRRWVEPDPEQQQALRTAWDLLLTDRYTLSQICDELTSLGFTRSGGRPWAWTNPKTGRRLSASNRLHDIFHNPFYAGWVVSKRFGIILGEVQGNWEPVVSPEEFERGLRILQRSYKHPGKPRRRFYLLRRLLWVRVKGREYKLYGSSPRTRFAQYAYYITHVKPNGSALRFSCEDIDRQVPRWLSGIALPPDCLPAVREIYCSQIVETVENTTEEETVSLNHQLSEYRGQLTHLTRLHISGTISEEEFLQLRAEWEEKIQNAQMRLINLERDVTHYRDDLEVALALLRCLPTLAERLDKESLATLLEILAKRIIINSKGEISDCELHTPFAYLKSLATNLDTIRPQKINSSDIRIELAPKKNLASHPKVTEQFLAGLRFENRNRLAELPIDITRLG